MTRLTLFLSLFLFSVCGFSQKNYWVFFEKRDFEKKEVVSAKTLENRILLNLEILQESDYGPSDSDLKKLREANIKIRNVSRWLNAASVEIDDLKQLEFLSLAPGIAKIKAFTGDFFYANHKKTTEDWYISFALGQMNAPAFLDHRLNGGGVSIGVIDGGFLNANSDKTLTHIFKNKQIKSVKDFYFPDKKDFYGEKKSDQEFHGTAVMSFIGGVDFERKLQIGMAPAADFYLARTESSTRESRVEEDNWLAAVEWLDSLGVRLVNSSLGYAQGFTNPAENYQPEQMDGQTSVIAQAAKIAAEKKGMILVLSAGNEGENKPWGGYVSTPGDVENAISVGANDQNGLKMNYSSKGREDVKFLKPDLTAFSEFGTSFAAPLITGFVACLLQKNPAFKLPEIKSILSLSGDYAQVPNNFIGSGFPKADLVLKLLSGETTELKIENKEASKYFVLKIKKGDKIAIFHKKDQRNVVSQEFREGTDSKIKIKRPTNVFFSTINHNGKIYEVRWKD